MIDASKLPLPAVMKAHHVCDNQMLEIQGYDIGKDQLLSRWDTMIHGERLTVSRRIDKEDATEAAIAELRAETLQAFKDIEAAA